MYNRAQRAKNYARINEFLCNLVGVRSSERT